MRVELMSFNRCCFCIPLRYGLLVWAYLKLMNCILQTYKLIFILTKIISIDTLPLWTTIVLVFLLICCLTDIAFSVTLIVGAHKKNYKLIRIYYYFAIIALGLWTLLVLVFFILVWSLNSSDNRYEHTNKADEQTFPNSLPYGAMGTLGLYILNFGLQLYIILLIRSEFLKLKRNSRFQFINNEAECESLAVIMKVEEGQQTA